MNETADYIIVGAGAAGCLLANRLSADSAKRVLLLEAGGRDWNPLIKVPMAAGLLYYLPALNWGYQTEAQAALNQRCIAWPRGRVMGGSTAINGMMYIRGQRQDYDDWAAMGLQGWSYNEVLPYFKSFENNRSHLDDELYHGRSGEWYTEKAKGENPLYQAWLHSALAAGHVLNEDFNGAEQEGVGLYDFNIKDGKRVSAASAFLDPIRARSNLRIIKRTQVTRLIFEQRRCVGAECVSAGKQTAYRASREVIVAAGAVNSPQILQMSGIGDAALLGKFGIPCIVDRPQVGANLQEHIGLYVQNRCRKPITLYGLMRLDRALMAGLKALLFGAGPAASVPLEAGGFLKTDADLKRPDVHITFVPGLSLATTQWGQMEHGFLTNIYPLRPRSRGRVSITSPDPLAKPAIQPNYLSAEEDLACLRRGVDLIRDIARQAPLDSYRGAEIAPGKEVATPDELDQWIRETANTIFHPVGTCRMGADEDAVLDAQLNVRGVEGLRVIDASSMPQISSGNTSAPTMMIAEKGAAMILNQPGLGA